MIYIKSTLVGIVTLVVATIVYIPYAFFVMMRTYTSPPGDEIALDLRALLSSPTYWLTQSRQVAGVRKPVATGFQPGAMAVVAERRLGRGRRNVSLAVPRVVREVNR